MNSHFWWDFDFNNCHYSSLLQTSFFQNDTGQTDNFHPLGAFRWCMQRKELKLRFLFQTPNFFLLILTFSVKPQNNFTGIRFCVLVDAKDDTAERIA